MSYDFQLRFPKKDQDVVAQIKLFVDAASSIFRVETKQIMPEPGIYFIYNFFQFFNFQNLDCLVDIRKLCCIFNYTKTPTGNKEAAFTIPRMLEDLIQFSTVSSNKNIKKNMNKKKIKKIHRATMTPKY